jgi:1-acyl-sn-glycerol-3-phosphate acyltransferase
MLDLDVTGHEWMPAGPKLIVANHPSTSDPCYLPLVFSTPIDMLLIDTVFRVPLVGTYLRRAGQVSVVRGDGQAAFVEAKRRLAAGRSVALFPEGNVSPREGGTLVPRSGAARLALISGAPVVPVGIGISRERLRDICASFRRRRLSGHWYLRGPYFVSVGRPLRFEGDVTDTAHVESVSTTIMDHISVLAHQSESRLKK